MSEFINNKEQRQKTIREIIRQLHDGKTVEQVKKQFEDAFHDVSASELSEAEGALIAEGLPVEEVQRLCDVHAAVFKGSIAQIHEKEDSTMKSGHPLQILKLENRVIEKIIETQVKPYLLELKTPEALKKLTQGIENLKKIHIHYLKKENLFFPFMEKYGISAPPKVMWGVDDEIRTYLKNILIILESEYFDQEELVGMIQETLGKIEDMIVKEENIMTPMLLENLKKEDWMVIANGSYEIGFLIDQVPAYMEEQQEKQEAKVTSNPEKSGGSGLITLPSGVFTTQELTCVLNSLPFDITFVDKNDLVKYFSEGTERTFPRTRAIIGRNVSNCHPPSSVHVVEKIVEDFKSGTRNQADFWIKMAGKYVLIRYYAVRDEHQEYLGVLEVTQDIAPIQEITGERRLLSE